MGALVEILKSGIVTNALGSQYRLSIDAKCDIMGALQRILGTNHSARKVFGEATGFSLLLTTLHGFQSEGGDLEQPSLNVCIKVFTHLLRVVTVGVSDNAVNRVKLHEIICSQTFSDLLSDSGLFCAEHEKQVIQLMLELALEIVIPPSSKAEDQAVDELSHILLLPSSGPLNVSKARVYNAGVFRVLISGLKLFTPKTQLELLDLIEKLARAGPLNLENLSSVGMHDIVYIYIIPFEYSIMFLMFRIL